MSAGQAASTSPRSRASASGAGSQARTANPRARKYATQPPPMTPAPTQATVRTWSGATRSFTARSARISRASSGVATSAPIAVMIVTALATRSALVTLLPRPR